LRTVFLAVLFVLVLAARADAAAFVVGQGFKPGLAVDPTGTAYIAWYGPEAGNSTLRFCRLPRGATACDVAQTLNAPGTSLSRPFVLVSGSTVRIAHYRYALPSPSPFAQILVFTSVDGGRTFDGGRPAGEAPFDEAVAGPDGTLTVATNVWQNGGVIQRIPLGAGSAGSSWAALFGGERSGNGTVGYTPDGRLLAIFTGGVADAAYRVHSGLAAGDVNNPGTWGPAVALGYADYPRLANGPTGLFVLAGDANGVMYARRWNGTGFDPAVNLGPGDASESSLFVDPGGRLHAVYSRLDVAGWHLQHAVSDDGAEWRSGSVVVQSDDQVGAPRVAAAADHAGLAVWSSRSALGAEIRVSAIGPEPALGETVVVRPVSGTVRVRLPGSSRFVALGTIDDVPLGATIDTKRGRIELRAINRSGGPVEKVQLYQGIFKVSQGRGLTTFTLNEPLAPCSKRARAAASKPKSRKLWGNGKGAFRTQGKYSAATVRGTRWLVKDSCAGTLTQVAQGAVAVTQKGKKRVKILRAPRKYLVRPPR
jgi:hypothetical protein